jgi:hypothetical protein
MADGLALLWGRQPVEDQAAFFVAVLRDLGEGEAAFGGSSPAPAAEVARNHDLKAFRDGVDVAVLAVDAPVAAFVTAQGYVPRAESFGQCKQGWPLAGGRVGVSHL